MFRFAHVMYVMPWRHLCGSFKDEFDTQVRNSSKRLGGDVNLGVISKGDCEIQVKVVTSCGV